jgi:hypothetical protein
MMPGVPETAGTWRPLAEVHRSASAARKPSVVADSVFAMRSGAVDVDGVVATLAEVDTVIEVDFAPTG